MVREMGSRGGAPEAIGDPVSLSVAAITINFCYILGGGGLPWSLLIPFNGAGAVLTAQGAGELD